MIKLIRNLNQPLLTDNKFNTIGVLVLIVIGIFAALHMSNWNELNKTKTLETKILKELRSDLTQHLIDIETNLKRLKVCMQANEIVINHMENGLPYHDSLDYHFANLYPYTTFQPNQTTFNYLKQVGIFIISNDSLRNGISDLYAYQFNTYHVFENAYFFEHYSNYIKPMFIAEFETFEFYNSFKPQKYNRFIKNEKYKPIMKYTIDASQSFIFMQSGLKNSVEKLISDIDKEIIQFTQ